MKAEKLLNPEEALAYLSDKIPDFVKNNKLKQLRVTAIKRHLDSDKDYYHLVLRYDSEALGDYPIFCTAHSQEGRATAFRALAFIKDNYPERERTFIPQPLFYDKEWRALFYRGLDGKNFLHFVKNPAVDLSEMIGSAAKWISNLHSIPAGEKQNFNPGSGRIRTAVPGGPEYFLQKIGGKFPSFLPAVEKYFFQLVESEEKLLDSSPERFLIHGDFHPENVISAADGKIVSVIDFTDICLGRWTRDLANFVAQLLFMGRGYRSEEELGRYQDLFLKNYRSFSGRAIVGPSAGFYKIYLAWTALRTVIYFLTKEPPEAGNAKTALADCEGYLKL